MDANDSRCRCMCKIVARDLRLVANQLYRMAVTMPQVTCCHYIIPLFRPRPPGLHKPYKQIGRKGKEALYNNTAYVLVQTQQSHNKLVPYGSVSECGEGETDSHTQEQADGRRSYQMDAKITLRSNCSNGN